jgi:SAM-dependent methyltransferase
VSSAMPSDPPEAPSLGKRGISEALRRFTAEMPYERLPILDFVTEVASGIEPGTRVLDLGAGDAPYRELFARTNYVTSDWEKSPHAGASHADIVAPASALPIESSSVGFVLCTQVLEHVADPGEVLGECLRVLEPGGQLALTVPLVWQLHELPYDYYRYTAAGIEHLLVRAGFVNIEIRARNDSFTTLAQLMLNVRSTMGRAPDGLDERREQVQMIMGELAAELARFASLDVNRTLPLGYAILARRP